MCECHLFLIATLCFWTGVLVTGLLLLYLWRAAHIIEEAPKIFTIKQYKCLGDNK